MKRILLPIGLVLLCMSGEAQQTIDVSNSNVPITTGKDIASGMGGLLFSTDKFVKVTAGTPFFKEKFMKATLYDADGNKYSGDEVRLNLLDNQINYKDASGQEFICTSPIKRLKLTDTTDGNQYNFVLGDQLPFPDNSMSKQWFRVLVNGPVNLCVHEKKSIHETIPYGNATTEQDIRDIEYYYVGKKGAFTEVKSWQDFLNFFADKKDAVDEYVKDNHLKGKSPADYVKVVKFYNGVCV